MPRAMTNKDLVIGLLLYPIYLMALAVYNVVDGLFSPITKLLQGRQQQEVFNYDTSIKVDTLSVLPTEVFQQILSHLPPRSYIATKFVNRAFHAATLHDLRGFRGTSHAGNPDQHAYVSGVIELEVNHTGPALELLTCSHCGKRAGNDINGFSDEEFVRTNAYRRCLKCLKPSTCTVKGVVMKRCHRCESYAAGKDDEWGRWMAVPKHWCFERRDVKTRWARA